MYRSSDRSPGNWRGIGYQIQDRSLKWLEPQADHKRTGNGYRSAEPRRPFQESAESKRHQQHLQAPVRRDRRYRQLHDFELAGLNRNVIQKHGSNHDPYYFQKSERGAVQEAHHRQPWGHAERHNGNNNGSRRARYGAQM